MSTYLQLCQKMRQNCRDAGTGPSTVVSQTGLLKNVVDWIADAWNDIQTQSLNWRWMTSQFTVNTVASDDTYLYSDCTDSRASAVITRFAAWRFNQSVPLCYLTSGGVSGQYRLIPMPWEDFKDIYKFGSQQSNTGMPIHITINEHDEILLGPNPDAVYTVTGEYQRGPLTLSANADEPDMPSRFHDLIVYRAIEKYAANYVKQEQYSRALVEGGRLMSALQRSQLPRITLGEPLA